MIHPDVGISCHGNPTERFAEASTDHRGSRRGTACLAFLPAFLPGFVPDVVPAVLSAFVPTVVSAFLPALLLAVLPPPAAASFVVSPMELHLSLSPGASETATLALRNTGRRSLLLKLYLSDSRFGPDGAEEELPLGSLERSCAPWLSLNNPLVELAPGESRSLDLALAVPGDARGGYWTKLYVEEMSQPEPSRKEFAGRRYEVYIKQRMGVRIFAELPGTADPEALVKKVSVQRDKAGRSYVLSVANAGRTLLHCHGNLELRDESGAVLETLAVGSADGFMVFPGGEREFTVKSVQPLAPGTYTALAIIDYGGDQLVAGEEVFKAEENGPMLVKRTADAALRGQEEAK